MKLHSIRAILTLVPLCVLASFVRADVSELVDYRLSGSTLEGTLNGVSFTGATWSISGTAAKDLAAVGASGPVAFNLLPLVGAPTMIIDDGSNRWTVTLENNGNFGWFVSEVDYSFFLGAGGVGYAFQYMDTSLPLSNAGSVYGFVALGTGVYNTITAQSSFSFSGTGGGGGGIIYLTSGGELDARVTMGGASAEFVAGAIPEPANIATLAGAGLLVCAGFSRRRV